MKEQALKERLKFIAKVKQRNFQEVWRLLLLERLLVRLAHSDYHHKFIFKGGLLLAHYLTIARETSDIDLLAQQMKVEMLRIKQAFNEICSLKNDDGFAFSCVNIEELGHIHMNYTGYRVRIDVRFGNMKDRVHVDVGVGDIVEAKQESLELYQYKGKPIFEDSVSLQVYPVETIFAEKLESIISRGSANSRMKDFHDILLLSREKHLINGAKLNIDINNTFTQRQTKLTIPIKFTTDECSRLQPLWSAHLRGLGDNANNLHLPTKVTDLLAEINTWLQEIVLELYSTVPILN